MKKFGVILLVMVLLVSMIGIVTAFAGASVSISGKTSVQAGKTYTYTVSISGTAFNWVAEASSGGKFSSASANCDASGSSNGSLSISKKLSVTVASDAKPGDTCTIKVSGEGCTVDENLNPTGSFSISKTLTATVVTAPAATPKKTRDPNATPRPTETPEGWTLLNINIDEAEQGAALEFSMEEDTKIPTFVLSSLVEKKGSLTIDFGTYKVTVNAADLKDMPEAETLDLGVVMEKSEDLSAVAGGKDVYQLHFNHSGQLPGKFTYSFAAEGQSPGDVLYLYYYYGDAGVIEGKAEAVVDENGIVTFVIYHCSSYFVTNEVLPDALHNFEQEVVAAEPLATPEPTVEPTPEPTATPEPVPDTQDESAQTPGVSIVALIIALIATALLSVTLTIFIGRATYNKKASKPKKLNKPRDIPPIEFPKDDK